MTTLPDNIAEGTECFVVGFDQTNLPADVTVDPSTAAVCINDGKAVVGRVLIITNGSMRVRKNYCALRVT